MKKLILVSLITSCLTSLSANGQGYVLFTATPRTVWDSYSIGPPHAPDINVAFLWATQGAVPSVDSIGTSTPITNGWGPWPAEAWSDILTDPNFILAENAANSTMVIAATTAAGGISYNASATFPVSGTIANTYTLFVIGWSSTFATPALAAAGGSVVGWSAPFDYTMVSSIGTPLTFSMSGLQPFGVVAYIPEPSTMALAGLGSLSLLLFHRRHR